MVKANSDIKQALKGSKEQLALCRHKASKSLMRAKIERLELEINRGKGLILK